MDQALDSVQRVRHAEFWQQAAAPEHSAEVPFMVATAPTRLLAGVIDLIHKEPAGWMITDYKTDADSSPEKASAYALQLESYKKALAECGLPVAGAKLTPVRG